MAVRLPSTFGMDMDDSDAESVLSRVTASGFTTTTARQSHRQQGSEPFPVYVEPGNGDIDMRGLADMIKTMSEKVNDLESIATDTKKGTRKFNINQNDINDDATRITQKIMGLNLAPKSSIMPNDSVSQCGFQHAAKADRIKDDQTFIQSVSTRGGSLYDNVIGGYAQTPEEKLEELEALTKIRKIHGIPQIFMNERLNFLIHLHKPLMSLLAVGDNYPSEDTLYRIDEFMRRKANKVRTQHEDLLYSVIETTIKRGKIRANPHSLPVIEVGMDLTDKIAFLCFSSLYKEFQNEWFQSMKDIDAPKFHNSYSNFKSVKPTREHRSGGRHQQTKRTNTSGSVISLFRH